MAWACTTAYDGLSQSLMRALGAGYAHHGAGGTRFSIPLAYPHTPLLTNNLCCPPIYIYIYAAPLPRTHGNQRTASTTLRPGCQAAARSARCECRLRPSPCPDFKRIELH